MTEAAYYDFDIIDEEELRSHMAELVKMHPSAENLDERYNIASILSYGRALRDQGYTPVYLEGIDDDEFPTLLLTVEETLTYH